MVVIGWVVFAAVLQTGRAERIVQPVLPPGLHVYNAIIADGNSMVDLYIDGVAVAHRLARENTAGPFERMNLRTGRLSVRKPDSAGEILQMQFDVSTKDQVVVLTGNPNAQFGYIDMPVPKQSQNTERSKVSVLNAIPFESAQGNLDFYVLEPGQTVNAIKPFATNVPYKSSGAVEVKPGIYTIAATRSGTQITLARSPEIDAKASDRRAAIAIEGAGEEIDKIATIDL